MITVSFFVATEVKPSLSDSSFMDSKKKKKKKKIPAGCTDGRLLCNQWRLHKQKLPTLNGSVLWFVHEYVKNARDIPYILFFGEEPRMGSFVRI